MYIQPNKLLPSTSKVIRPYQCSFISTSGPNISSKINLSGVEIPYYSQFTTSIILNPESTGQPLLYGFLGTEVTFILLKITFDETDPRCQIEEEQFIEYYFGDNPTEIRYANKLLLLTGNSQRRIPQLYLNNPSQLKVVVEAMVANLEQSDISLDDVRDNAVSLTNLYHNSILSDTFWNCSFDVSGSSQLQVVDYEDNISLYLDYSEIDTIDVEETKNQLIIDTRSDTKIYLTFLSQFEMYQAHSRMEWVMEDANKRFLTKDAPSLDVVSPVITYNTGVNPLTPSGNTYTMPIQRDPNTNTFVITSDDIINYFIDTIIDNRDGVIDKHDTNITIRRQGELLPLTGITQIGTYDITMTIKDIANNQTLANILLLIDDVPPEIIFNNGITNPFYMNIPGDTQVPNDGITHDDIIRKTVDYVIDSNDGIIPNSQIQITITNLSGNTEYTNVNEPGEYLITYAVADSANNYVFYDRNMIVEGNIILNSGTTFTFGPTMTTASFIFTGESGETANVILSGQTIVVGNSGGSFVWDLSGVNEYLFTYSGETVSLTYNGTIFEITWDGIGSLLFTIDKIGSAPNFSNLLLNYQYKQYNTDEFTTIDINKLGDIYPLTLDNNSESVYNIKIKDVDYNRETFTVTGFTLESFELDDNTGVTYITTTGTSLYQYYNIKYPNYNTSDLDNILLGNLSFGEIFKINDNFIINDFISTDDMESIVIYGNYPKGTYNFNIRLVDESNNINNVKFILLIV